MSKNTKQSIALKVVIGYILLTVFAGASVWFIYNKTLALNEANRLNTTSQQKLLLISKAVTSLYTTESIGRSIIQNNEKENLPKFNRQLDTIGSLVDSLKNLYTEREIKVELDSLQKLLSLKKQNLLDLLEVREKNASNNYYDRVLNRLQEVNYIFESQDYNKLLKNYNPHARRALVKWLEYAKKDNAERLTQQSADSLVNTLKTVLSEMEVEEERYREEVLVKINDLIKNDQELSLQLRKIRAEIERDEIQQSVAQFNKSQKIIEETSTIIVLLAIACVITVFVFVLLILKDTNRSQQYRKELEKAKAYAELLLKRREQFMATVTHDLRTPLNTLSGYADLLKNTSLTEKQEHYLQQLQKSSVYILHLVNDLLEFSKLESGKVQIEKLPFNPKNLLKDSIDGVIPSENEKNVHVDFTSSDALDKNYFSDPFRIKQILMNLIGNAYKFTENGTITITANLDTSAVSGDKLKISIADTGIGISKAKQKIIFNEFSQAGTSIEKKYGGSGLGLAITKRLVNLLGGSIELESKEGEGSIFSIFIPVENAKRTYTDNEENKIKIPNTRNKKLLLIDDEETQLALNSEILKQAGFSFIATQNPKEAIKLVKKEKFDLILTDIQMPGLNGFKLLRKLKDKKYAKDIPIIALSGRIEVPAKIYIKKGFATNLIKPFHANELLRTIAKVLDLPTTTEKINRKTFSKNNAQNYSLKDLKIFTDNDADALKLLLQTFIDNTRDNCKNLKAAAKKKEYQKIAFTAHKMLPMFRQLKAENVIKNVEPLERQHELNLENQEILKLVEAGVTEIEKLLEDLKTETNAL
ncbi:ATP-binding response regulator [Haloflavibacter putidus]|uniref:histidine kinase n=1 Tax=Haloflavibacter putidus TaxID=2576776 RepID=A0A507ZPS4_9FLAO|nr:ATP-binding protein [Haloflavibacter putidus]TQD38503.1 response regulator [Haloflavibacter putidus]